MSEPAYHVHAPDLLVARARPWGLGVACSGGNARRFLWLGATTTVARVPCLRLRRHRRRDRIRGIAIRVLSARDLSPNRRPQYSDPRRPVRQQPESESTAVVAALRAAD